MYSRALDCIIKMQQLHVQGWCTMYTELYIVTLNSQVFHDAACKKEILSLDVYCDHVDNGCSWIGPLKELEVTSRYVYNAFIYRTG